MHSITSHPSEALEGKLYPTIAMHIGGKWIADRPSWSDVRNPSTENILGQVPKANAQDLQDALTAAQSGFAIWRSTAPQDRARVILKGVAILRSRVKEIAQILTLENGKHLGHAEAEISRCANFFEWDVGQSLRAFGLIVPGEPQMQKFVLRQPIGPVVAFTPWNVPMSSAARKTSAAMAAGCSVILKAAEETPGTACEMVRCFEEAGLPPGVLNLVFGDPAEISQTLIASPITRLVTFTGSTAIGKHLTELAARAMKPVLMELGGNAPVIVCDSVDATAVGQAAVAAKSIASGQICASASRFIVHEAVYDTFIEAFARGLDALCVADGFAEGAQMGPVANAKRLAAAEAMVADARDNGARIAAGGYRIGNRGYFYAPTLIADAPTTSLALREEPFSPIAACTRFSTLDEALKIANGLSVGLAAYAFTNLLEESERLMRELECGVLSINHFGTPDADTPFGGVKDSGIGREGGPGSLDAYLTTKTVLQSTRRA